MTVLIFLGAWSVVAIFLALLVGRMLRNPLGPVTPRPVEGETHPVAAADGSPTGPSRTGSGVRPNLSTSSLPADVAPGSEAVSPATRRDVRVVAGDASTNFPAPNAGNGPLEC